MENSSVFHVESHFNGFGNPSRESFFMQVGISTMAAYNRWANTHIYDGVALLSSAEFVENRGAFFGSVCGTLNHLLVGDYLWMGRIDGLGPTPDRLDSVLHENFDALRQARETADVRLIEIVDGLEEAALADVLSYQSVTSGPQSQVLGLVLAHIFNHQTHHRAQVHTLLSQFGKDAPSIDYIYFLLASDQPS